MINFNSRAVLPVNSTSEMNGDTKRGRGHNEQLADLFRKKMEGEPLHDEHVWARNVELSKQWFQEQDALARMRFGI